METKQSRGNQCFPNTHSSRQELKHWALSQIRRVLPLLLNLLQNKFKGTLAQRTTPYSVFQSKVLPVSFNVPFSAVVLWMFVCSIWFDVHSYLGYNDHFFPGDWTYLRNWHSRHGAWFVKIPSMALENKEIAINPCQPKTNRWFPRFKKRPTFCKS